MQYVKKVSWLLLLVLAAWYAFLGWTETFYGMGIFLVPIVLLLAGIITGVVVLYKKEQRRQSLHVFSWIGALCFAGLIIAHKIEHYTPTYSIHIPEDFTGMVYLLPGKTPNSELYVDANGIGYYAPHSEVDVRVYHGSENATNALHEYGSRTLIFPQPDSATYMSLYITCFYVEKGRVYGNSPWNQTHVQCMNEATFKARVAAGSIDLSRVRMDTLQMR